MLYSMSYTQIRRKERRLFYADSDEEAMDKVRTYAERNGLLAEYIRIEQHPRGCYIESKLFPRFLPAQEKKKKGEQNAGR